MGMTTHEEEDSLQKEAILLKRITFIAITVTYVHFIVSHFHLSSFSSISVLTCIIAVPGLYHYLQHIHSTLQNEVLFNKYLSKFIIFTSSYLLFCISTILGIILQA